MFEWTQRIDHQTAEWERLAEGMRLERDLRTARSSERAVNDDAVRGPARSTAGSGARPSSTAVRGTAASSPCPAGDGERRRAA